MQSCRFSISYSYKNRAFDLLDAWASPHFLPRMTDEQLLIFNNASALKSANAFFERTVSCIFYPGIACVQQLVDQRAEGFLFQRFGRAQSGRPFGTIE